jgi:hypothetical protein
MPPVASHLSTPTSSSTIMAACLPALLLRAAFSVASIKGDHSGIRVGRKNNGARTAGTKFSTQVLQPDGYACVIEQWLYVMS